MKNVNELTIGEVEQLVEKAYQKVKSANYQIWDYKLYAMEVLETLMGCITDIKSGEDYFNNEEFLDKIISNFQKPINRKI